MADRSTYEKALEGHVSLLHDTYLKAPALMDPADLQVLREAGLITEDQAQRADRENGDMSGLPLTVDRSVISFSDYMERIDKRIIRKWENKDIFSRDWKPEIPEQFDDDFVRFILSTHRRFCDLDANEQFYLYLEQKNRWMRDPKHAKDVLGSERDQYRAIEIARCKANLLYMADKYGYLKDGDPELGSDRFEGTLAHAHMFFLFDQGRSPYEAKVRQMGSSSAKGLMATKIIAFQPDTVQVMIANDRDSGEGLLESKVKWPFSRLPDWMKPEPVNTPDGFFRVTFSPDKEHRLDRKADSSEIEVRTPSIEAINSRSPRVTYVDEASFISMFEAMVKEALPTLWRYEPSLKRRVMKRQLIAFSTGGRAQSGNGSYEREYRGLVEKWRRRDYSECFVPVFYDWTCQPGASHEFYVKQMKSYQAGSQQGHTHMSIQERMTQFRQHYPASIDDVFLTSKATLIPLSIITKDMDKINKYEHEGIGVEYGSMSAIFGPEPMPAGSPFHHKILQSNWKPSPEEDPFAPIQIWQHPDLQYSDRYFMGVDPIEADIGFSKMAAVVYDAHYGTVSATVNYRTDDPRDPYLQVALLNKYYGGGKHIPMLVEVDIGKDFMSFVSGPWLDMRRALVGQWQLPDYFQGKSGQQSAGHPDMMTRLGVSSKGGNKVEIINRLKDMLMSKHRKIHHMEVFSQLLHFVGLPVKGLAANSVKWQSEDREKYQDDLLMALAYGYICRLCFPNKQPRKREQEEKTPSARTRTLQWVETDFGEQLIRV